MKQEAEVRNLLIGNTIHLIAEGGFEKATTKEITHVASLPGVKMNEVYIYRLFENKQHLYETAFITLDAELMQACKRGVEAVGGFQADTKVRMHEFFNSAWRFVMRNEERCRCYVRYYYSTYYRGEAVENHKKNFRKIVAEFEPLFKEEADVPAIMHSVFTTFLDFAIRVFNGDLEDSEINRPHIFNVLYCMMATYFKDSVRENQNKSNA